MSASRQARIRRARPDEAEALSRLAFRSKAHWGYAEAFMEACRAELTLPPAYLAEHPVFVVEDGPTPIGFYALERLSDGEAELGYLFVDPSWIGRGYGRRLIEHAKAHARSLGYRSLLIQGDPNAARFYRAAGGRRVGARASASIAGRALPLFRVAL